MTNKRANVRMAANGEWSRVEFTASYSYIALRPPQLYGGEYAYATRVRLREYIHTRVASSRERFTNIHDLRTPYPFTPSKLHAFKASKLHLRVVWTLVASRRLRLGRIAPYAPTVMGSNAHARAPQAKEG
ncbi:hypothetical protein AB1N83_008399 [Pleurotus pulmonarius]